MAIFTDSFNRANGALGGNWATTSGSPTILSNWVYNASAGSCEAYNTTVSGNDYHQCTVRCNLYAGASNAGPVVKTSGASGTHYYASVVFATPNYYLRIYGGNMGAEQQLASVQLASAPPGIYTITLIYDNGNLTATLSTGESVTVANSSWPSGQYMGIRALTSLSQVDWVTMVTDAATAFDVEPEAVGNFGDPVSLTATGTNTAWTSGTPGAPTFTCDHGTITSQTISGATSATLTYDPGDYLGAVTFTDPSTGETDTIIVSSDPIYLPGGLGQFSEEAVAYIERSAAESPTSIILNQGSEVDIGTGVRAAKDALGDFYLWLADLLGAVPQTPATPEVISQLWLAINGGYYSPDHTPTPPRNTSVKEELESFHDLFLTGVGTNRWTINALADSLAGDPFASHQDILTAIDGLTSPDLQPVLDAISTLRGDGVSTVAFNRLQLDSIRTASLYTLGHVMTAIQALPQTATDLQPVLDAIGQLSVQLVGAENRIKSDIALATATIVAVQAALATLGGVVDTISTTVDGIVDLINALPDPTAPPTTAVWPGQANATLGNVVALTDGLELVGPMHGIFLTITGTPPQAGRYIFGNVRSWTHAGAVMFKADLDYYERPESIGIDSHIITPRTMAEAASCILRVNEGWTGTVRTWSRNA